MEEYKPQYNSVHDYKMDLVEASSSPFTTMFKRQVELGTYPVDSLVKFVESNVPNILYSSGTFITQCKNYDKIMSGLKSKTFTKLLDREVDKIREAPWFRRTPLVIDSGGHQLIMGHLKTIDSEIVNEYSKEYFTWLKNKNTANMGFSLDIHADRPMVDSAKHLYELNEISVSNMLEIFENNLDKIIWVYQFRSKFLNRMWLKLMDQFKIFQRTSKHSIGGVAQFSKMGSIKFPIYIPPAAITIANMLKHRKDKNQYHLFHILGVMNPTDLIQFALIQRSAERFHHLNLHVTLDSSKIFSAQSVAANLEYLIGGKLYKISFKSKDLDKRSPLQGYTNEQLLRHLFESLDSKYGFPQGVHDTRIYVENDKGGYSINKSYWTRVILLSYIHLNNLIRRNLELADKLIDLYLKGKKHQFNTLLHKHQKDMNPTGGSNYLIEKSQNYFEGVRLLHSLNVEAAEGIIDRLFPELDIFR